MSSDEIEIQSENVRVSYQEGVGRCLLASRDIKGEDLFMFVKTQKLFYLYSFSWGGGPGWLPSYGCPLSRPTAHVPGVSLQVGIKFQVSSVHLILIFIFCLRTSGETSCEKCGLPLCCDKASSKGDNCILCRYCVVWSLDISILGPPELSWHTNWECGFWTDLQTRVNIPKVWTKAERHRFSHIQSHLSYRMPQTLHISSPCWEFWKSETGNINKFLLSRFHFIVPSGIQVCGQDWTFWWIILR